MTQLMERAVAEVRQLPDGEQDRYALSLLHEIENEKQWDATFARNREKLERLALEALAEDDAGKTLPLDLETMFPE